MVAVRVTHMEVIGWQAPHELKIEITGRIDETVGDDIVLVAHEFSREFLEDVGPAISEAFKRVFLDRLRNGEYKWADRARPPAKVNGVDLASKPGAIEDIEL